MPRRLPARAPGYLCPGGSPWTLVGLLSVYAALGYAGGASALATFLATGLLASATVVVWGMGYRSARSLHLALLAVQMGLYMRRHDTVADAFEAFACDHQPSHYRLALAVGALAWPGQPLIRWSDA